MKRATSYEYDLFLSYAHIDNEPLIEGRQSWVSTFHHALGVCLGQLGVKPKVWRDRENLRGSPRST